MEPKRVGNGSFVALNRAINKQESTEFYESASFAKLVSKKKGCTGVRPSILMVYSEGNRGSGPDSISVWSLYVTHCFHDRYKND